MDLDLVRIEEAARIVDPVFRDSPQFASDDLCAALGRDVLVKIETANPVGSFKGRGADYLTRTLPPGGSIVCASSGNFGVALAYTAKPRGIGVHVYVSPDISPPRLARMQNLGATVSVADGDAGQAARAHAAAHPGCVLANNHPAVAEGAGTIGVELLRAGRLDTVVLPVSDGTLITGTARWIKAHSPRDPDHRRLPRRRPGHGAQLAGGPRRAGRARPDRRRQPGDSRTRPGSGPPDARARR